MVVALACGLRSISRSSPRSVGGSGGVAAPARGCLRCPILRSAFHRLFEPLDRRIIARAVATHGDDHGVGRGANAWTRERRLTCKRHLKSLLFAQWAGLTSRRKIVTRLAAHSRSFRSFYHLNPRAACRSTVSDANADWPSAAFRDIATALVPIAAGALRQQSEAVIRLIEASPNRSKATVSPGPRRMPARAA